MQGEKQLNHIKEELELLRDYSILMDLSFLAIKLSQIINKIEELCKMES